MIWRAHSKIHAENRLRLYNIVHIELNQFVTQGASTIMTHHLTLISLYRTLFERVFSISKYCHKMSALCAFLSRIRSKNWMPRT